MSGQETWSVDRFAKFMLQVVKADNQVLIGVAGETGKGKSTFLSQAFFAYGKINGVGWGFDNMTWSREELMTWIDGENKEDPVDPETNCRKGQRPEYSALMPDELIHMFSVENRFDKDQQHANQTLNMSRDRHLVIGGGVPNFWDLDSRTRGRFTFYVYVKKRGVAWVFAKEDNPFSPDQWNKKFNEKVLRRNPNSPWKSPNYVCTINFPDWEGELREKYYSIRNEKRVKAIAESEKREKVEKLGNKKAVIAFGNLTTYLCSVEGWSNTRIADLVEVCSDHTIGRWQQIAIDHYQKYKNDV